MANTIYVNVGGTWKTASNYYVNVNGTWKTGSEFQIKVNSNWKGGSSGPVSLPTYLNVLTLDYRVNGITPFVACSSKTGVNGMNLDYADGVRPYACITSSAAASPASASLISAADYGKLDLVDGIKPYFTSDSTSTVNSKTLDLKVDGMKPYVCTDV